VTAVALLGAVTACGDSRRQVLKERAVFSVMRSLATTARVPTRLGHPCLGRTDEAELLSMLARAAVSLKPEMVGALKRVQRRQVDGGKWRREVPIPRSLAVPVVGALGDPSRWITLKCVVALMAYAVEAQLPRMYPQKPG
jgi:hypothetical protein